jgi:hypothetical protein
MATVQNIIDDARIRLSDVSDLSYTDSALMAFHNEAVRHLAQIGLFRSKGTATFSGANKLAFTDIATNVAEIFRVDASTATLPPSRPDEPVFFSETTTGTPSTWMVIGQYLYVNVVYTGTLSVWYVYTPSNATSVSQDSPINAFWYNAVVDYVCYAALKQESDHANAQTFLDRFNEKLAAAQAANEMQIAGGMA